MPLQPVSVIINFYMIFSIYFEGYSFLFKILGFIILIIGIVIVGYFDTKLGILKTEFSKNNNQNPEVMEMLERLERIERKLK